MEALQEDTGDSNMQCTEHPFKNNTPAGGICPLCLQEKLGKLVSSSFPITIFPSSSSSSPSFTSDVTTTTTTTNTNTNTNTTTTTTTTKCHHQDYSNNRILYLIGQKKKKKKDLNIIINGGDQNKNLVFKRSKSTATPRRNLHYMEPQNDDGLMSQHKRGFWSFIHLQKYSHSSSSINNNNNKKTLTDISSNTLCASQQQIEIIKSPCHTSFDRKVSRSRSVGCGSRSFSGDFFEQISTGFGDCALRRVESQRAATRSGGHDCIKERVRCGGLFSGFMITSSSSSSSSSSYWIASNPNKSDVINTAGKVTSAMAGTDHGRSRSWGWALASPMRVFSKPSKPSSSKREGSIKNPSPNLGAVPSLLSMRS